MLKFIIVFLSSCSIINAAQSCLLYKVEGIEADKVLAIMLEGKKLAQQDGVSELGLMLLFGTSAVLENGKLIKTGKCSDLIEFMVESGDRVRTRAQRVANQMQNFMIMQHTTEINNGYIYSIIPSKERYLTEKSIEERMKQLLLLGK